MTVWTVSEASMGTLSQCVAVANTLDGPLVEKIVVPRRGFWRLFSKPLFKTSETSPAVIVSCGSRSESHVIKMKAAFNSRPFLVHLQRPKVDGQDLVFVSRHDWIKEYDDRPTYHRMLGVPHRFTVNGWQKDRSVARARYAPNDERIAVVLVGGNNGAYAYDHASLVGITRAIDELVHAGWKILVSVSRRTDRQTLVALRAVGSEKVIIWGNEGDNPYSSYLAAADAFLVAKDSITMPCEALSTGKPVYAMDLSKVPGERLEKFERFHEDMQNNLQLTRPYRGSLTPYSYTPPDEAQRIGSIVRRESAVHF